MSCWRKEVDVTDLIGKKISRIEGLYKNSDEVTVFTDGGRYSFNHYQEAGEVVYLVDFDGCAEDLIEAVILSAEVISGEGPSDWEYEGYSHTWCFYKIETDRGGIWMRWLGESNGYYGEYVDVVHCPEGGTGHE